MSGAASDAVSVSVETNAWDESSQFLTVEGPSVLECFNAVEMAKEAIVEVAKRDDGNAGMGKNPGAAQVPPAKALRVP